jgi:cell division protein FtsA
MTSMSSLAQRSTVRDRANGRGASTFAALDIGSSKVTCMIARKAECSGTEPRVAGAGAQGTKGVRSGAVVDLEALERSIRLAVEAAERAAETRITDIVLGVSGPDLRSDVVRAKLQLAGREITHAHVREAKMAALESFKAAGREILHSAPLGFSVDGTQGIRDPRGMFADSLTASFLVVSAPTAGLRNIVQCVARAHLNPTAILASPYASGLACLVEDEAEQGATVIDFGAGVTSAASFMDGGLIHVETLAMGGSRATSDLAQGLGTTFAAAERMKALYGAVGLTEVIALEMVDAPKLGPDGRLEANQCSRADIAQILRPRIEEILELLDSRISKASATGRPLPRRIVLTGGSSLLPGLRELAEDVFRAPVRLARPSNISGLGETYSSPSFAAVAGLLRWELMSNPETGRGGQGRGGEDQGQGLVKRVTGWLQENF